MQKYLEAEQRLAELLDWTRTDKKHGPFDYVWLTPDGKEALANWSRDESAAFQLLTDQHISVAWVNGGVLAKSESDGTCYFSSHTQHRHPDNTVHYAIVMACVVKLESALQKTLTSTRSTPAPC